MIKMDFFRAEEGLSLQDMIQLDLKSDLELNNEVSASGDISEVTGMDICNANLAISNADESESIMVDVTKPGCVLGVSDASGKLGDVSSWLNVTNVSDVTNLSSNVIHAVGENSDPNLMVDPQTVVPIIQASQSQALISPAMSNMSDTRGATQTLNQVNTAAARAALLGSANLNGTTQVIRTTQGHYISISTTNGSVGNLHSGTARPTITIQPTAQTVRQQLQAHQQQASPATMSPLRQQILARTQTSQLASNYQQTLSEPNSPKTVAFNNSNQKLMHRTVKSEPETGRIYPKPVYSYSCLIAMALKNSDNGSLPVSEIYAFMTENFPYFKTAPDGWKNSVRHNLSLNKCFEKIENPKNNGNTKKGCLWGMNPAKIEKMEEEIVKWRKKDPACIKRSMSRPEVLEALEKGQVGCPSPRQNIENVPSPSPIITASPTIITAAQTYTTTTSAINNNTKVVNIARQLAANQLQLQQQHHQAAATNPSSSAQDIHVQSPLTVIKQGSPAITSINGNINVVKVENGTVFDCLPSGSVSIGLGGASGNTSMVKNEDPASTLNNLTNEELSILDNNLDPALNDIVMQNGFSFDELSAEELNFDDFNCFTSNGSFSASPLTLPTAAGASAKEENPTIMALQNNLSYVSYMQANPGITNKTNVGVGLNGIITQLTV